jgi:hypothetical protein
MRLLLGSPLATFLFPSQKIRGLRLSVLTAQDHATILVHLSYSKEVRNPGVAMIGIQKSSQRSDGCYR